MKNTKELFPIECGGKVGFADEDGKIVVDYIYDKTYPFSVGLALVRVNGWWGYIDKTKRRSFLY